MPEKFVYRCVEDDVNGCGESAVEYVAFPRPLSRDEQKSFSEYLRDEKAACNDSDTGEMVQAALDRFLEDFEVRGEIISPNNEGELHF